MFNVFKAGTNPLKLGPWEFTSAAFTGKKKTKPHKKANCQGLAAPFTIIACAHLCSFVVVVVFFPFFKAWGGECKLLCVELDGMCY